MEDKQIEYPFEMPTQKKILASMVKEKQFLMEFSTIIKAVYFTKNGGLRELAHCIISIWEDKRQLITKSVLRDYLKLNRIQITNDLIEEVYNCNLQDGEVVKDHAIQFARRESIRGALVQASKMMQENGYNDFDKIENIISQSLRAGRPQSMGIDFFSTELTDILNPSYTGEKRKLGFPILDGLLGGLHAGDITPILAQSGKGKSIFLTNVGFNSLKSGLDVIHISLGDLREDDVSMRYLSLMGNMEMREILFDPKNPKINQKKQEFYTQYNPGKLIIHYYPGGFASPEDIKNICLVYRDQIGKNPGMIVLDYADELKPSYRRDSSYEEMGEIYGRLKTIGYELGSPMLTASQISRAYYSKAMSGEDIGMESTSDSMKKCFKADAIMSIAQTSEEMKKDSEGWQRARIYIAKNRRGEDGQHVRFRVNKSRMLFQEVDSIEELKSRNQSYGE